MFFLLYCFFLLRYFLTYSQNETCFKDNERLEYLAYYGFIKGGYAILTLRESDTIFHATAIAYSIGIVDKIYRVYDVYESFFSKKDLLSIKAIRNISEGNYRYYEEAIFDRENNEVISSKAKRIKVKNNSIDVLCAFYYARNFYLKNAQPGKIITINGYFDEKEYLFQIRCIGYETIETSLGKINCIVFSPVVERGRIFKTEDDVKIWISNDNNLIPIRLQINLIVGSLKCDLVKYENLKFDPFK